MPISLKLLALCRRYPFCLFLGKMYGFLTCFSTFCLLTFYRRTPFFLFLFYSFEVRVSSFIILHHYVSDFCCSVHFGGEIGNVREHIIYERALNCYALKNQDLLRAECRGPIKRGDLDSVLNEYSQSQKYNPYTDLILAVKACISVCEKAYAMKEAPDNVQTNSAFTA